jgi:hypothetical protein
MVTGDDGTMLLILERPDLGRASRSSLRHAISPRTLAVSNHRDQREVDGKEEDHEGREKKQEGDD